MRLLRLIHVSYACLFSGLVLLALAACLSSTPVPSPTTSLVPSLTPSFTLLLPTITPEGPLIRGVVLDTEGQPIPGATVRIQAITIQTLTDDESRFTLTGLEDGIPVTVSALADGYYCAKVAGVTPPASDVEFTMRLDQTNDNPLVVVRLHAGFYHHRRIPDVCRSQLSGARELQTTFGA